MSTDIVLLDWPVSRGLFNSPVSSTAFGADNWGRVNRFDLVLDGPPVGVGGPFGTSFPAKAFDAVINHGKRWQETGYYARVRRRIDAGIPRWNCTTVEELDARFDIELNALITSIRTHGLLDQQRVCTLSRKEPSLKPFTDDDYHATTRPSHNIKIGLNETGQALFLDGRNRLSAALALGIETIPVRVVFRHQRWHRLRQILSDVSALSAEVPGPLVAPGHPDLRALPIAASLMDDLAAALDEEGLSLPEFGAPKSAAPDAP